MKKVILGGLFAIVATIGVVSCNKDEVKPNNLSINSNQVTGEQESNIKMEEDAEKMRQEFASNMVTFMSDTREMYQAVEKKHSQEKSGEVINPTFEEFLTEIPGGDHLTDIGLQLVKEAYDLHISNASNDDIMNNYRGEGFIKMANEIIEGKQVNDVIFKSEINNQKVCDICPVIWDGVKKAASWTWENRYYIKEVIEWITEFFDK